MAGKSARHLLFVDVETTGLTYNDRVITLGAVELDVEALMDGADCVNTGHLIFNPGRPSNPFAAAVHGYDDWTLTFQPDFSAHADEMIAPFERADTIVAHNAAFDERFLRGEFSRAGHMLGPARFDCSMRRYKTKYGRPGGLDKVLAHMGHRGRGKVHGALEDAWLCMQVWLWLHGLPEPEGRDDLLHPPSNWVEPGMKPLRNARKVMSTGLLHRLGREDAEDFAIVRQRLAKPFTTIPNSQVWKDLGIED